MLLQDVLLYNNILVEMSAVQRDAVQIIRELYPNTHLVEDKSQIKQIFRQTNAGACVYILIADNNTAIIGEGTKTRADVLFSNIRVPFHQKAVVAALTYLLHENIVRMLIPVASKKEAKVVEAHLHSVFEFKKIKLVDKISELYQARLQQIQSQWSPKEIELFTLMFDLLGVLDPSGGELNYLPRKLPKAEKIAPGITEFTKLIFGGHYTNL